MEGGSGLDNLILYIALWLLHTSTSHDACPSGQKSTNAAAAEVVPTPQISS